MAFTVSPNMSLIVPGVGTEPGPTWASDLNTDLSILDSHDHSPGNGVQITPDGLDINADLSFTNNNATSLRSVRFSAQGAPLSDPSDVGCIYESGVDLYYNDGNGNQIRITASGGIAGSPGSIANLVSPASATYVSADETFVWESDTQVAANMDFRNAILRNDGAASKALTLSPPLAMAADYSLVLPSLPASTKIMRLDNSGNMSATLGVDNVGIEISSNNLQLKDGGVTKAKLAADIGSATTITASGNYNVAATTNVVHVLLVGGGGGGGGGGVSNGGGGGGGGSITEGVFAVTPSSTIAVTIGSGGSGAAGGSRGGQGNSSVFGSLLIARGGQGGSTGYGTSNGTGLGGLGGGGAGSGGQGGNVLGSGDSALSGAGAIGPAGGGGAGGAGAGGGGGGSYGAAGSGGDSGSGGTDAGSNTGGGGGGGGAASNNGGNGGSGICIVTVIG